MIEPSIIRHPSIRRPSDPGFRKRTTFTGAIGAVCMLPLRAIINLCVRLRIHPNTLRYRMRRVADLSGVDLTDANVRLALLTQLVTVRWT